MMIFFDYVFYRMAKVYKGTKDNSPEFAAVCLLSLLQCLNLFSIIIINWQIFHYSQTINKLVIGIIMVVWIILNAIRYNKLNYDILNEKWGNEAATTKKKKGTIVIIYILLSITLVIALIFRKSLQ